MIFVYRNIVRFGLRGGFFIFCGMMGNMFYVILLRGWSEIFFNRVLGRDLGSCELFKILFLFFLLKVSFFFIYFYDIISFYV